MGGSAECGLAMRAGVPNLPGVLSPLHAPLLAEGRFTAGLPQLLGAHLRFPHT